MSSIPLETVCQLISSTGAHPPIVLPDGIAFTVGRGPQTLITSKRCSRHQVELVANYSCREVAVQCLGTNPSKVGGKLIPKGETHILGPSGTLELLEDQFKYNIHFVKKPSEAALEQLRREGDSFGKDDEGERTESDAEDFMDELLKAERQEKDREGLDVSSSRKRKWESLNDEESASSDSTPAAKCKKLALKAERQEKDEESSDVSSSRKRKRESLNDEESASSDSTSAAKRKEVCTPAVNSLSETHTEVSSSKTQQQSLHSFFDGSSKGAGSSSKELEKQWKELTSVVIFQYGPVSPSPLIASFDLDGTLIETASGKRFAKDVSDWKFMPKVPEKLWSLHQDGYKIVIFTNQLGIPKGKPTMKEFRSKIEAIALRLGVPLLLLASTSQDNYRKPCVGLWYRMEEEENGKAAVDTEASFYVGDAAGRLAEWRPGAKKDFSCSDRKFAANLDIKFLTPDEFFAGHKTCTKFTWGDFDPRTLNYHCDAPVLEPSDAQICSDKQEVVIFQGCPASGKTTFFMTYMKPKGYVHVNRDKLGSWQKCVAECERATKAGKSVVIDNTNPSRESRLRYIAVCKSQGVQLRCFQFLTSIAHAKHNNRFRELTTSDSRYKKVTDIAFNTYKSQFSEPKLSEGFTELVKIESTPFKFTDELQQSLYKQFLV